MPKEAARIFLRVVDVRVERLQDMTLEGLKAEGFDIQYTAGSDFPLVCQLIDETEAKRFATLWNSHIKKFSLDRCGWNANPFVWVIEFERIEKPKTEN